MAVSDPRSWAEIAAPNTTAKPVFIMESDIFGNEKPRKDQWLTNVELYGILGSIVPRDTLRGIQRIPNGLWRIYADTNEAREALLYEGRVSIRNKSVTIHGVNPGSFAHQYDNSIRVRVKHIPLSADDGQIGRAITLYGCTVTSLHRERLRYEGKLTNCETGDRILTVIDMTTPLPRVMSIGKYRAVVLYRGQPDDRKECTKCLKKGHSSIECENDIVCRKCFEPGHISSNCPHSLDSDDSGESAAEEEPSEVREEADQQDNADTLDNDQPTGEDTITQQPDTPVNPTSTKATNSPPKAAAGGKVNSTPQTAAKNATAQKASTSTAQGSIVKFLDNKTPQRKSKNIPAGVRSPLSPIEQSKNPKGKKYK